MFTLTLGHLGVRGHASLPAAARLYLAFIVLAVVATACGEDSTKAVAANTNVSFPRQEGRRTTDAALLTGKLVLERYGCLRVDSTEPDASYLVIWPSDYSVSTKGGEIRVLDGRGRVVARVGDSVRMGGSAVESPDAKAAYEPEIRDLPEECPGPYWVVGEFPIIT